mmetsp:Transcript_26050/g.73616  ORF Transcript_26050/g.73616 Transcript_26050/m.73616 type:complete len:520 (+) Transcript_26050:699-2258(+)
MNACAEIFCDPSLARSARAWSVGTQRDCHWPCSSGRHRAPRASWGTRLERCSSAEADAAVLFCCAKAFRVLRSSGNCCSESSRDSSWSSLSQYITHSMPAAEAPERTGKSEIRLSSAKMAHRPLWGRFVSFTRTRSPQAIRSEYVAKSPSGSLDKCWVKVSSVVTSSPLPMSRMHSLSVFTMSRSMNSFSAPLPPAITYCSSRSKCVLTSGQICDTLWFGPSGMHVMLVRSSRPKTGSATSCHPTAALTRCAPATGASVPVVGVVALPPGLTALAAVDHFAGRDSPTSALARIWRLSAESFWMPAEVKSSTKPDRATNCFTCWCTVAGSEEATGRAPPALALASFRRRSPRRPSLPAGLRAPSSSSSSSSRVSSSNQRVRLSKKPSPESCFLGMLIFSAAPPSPPAPDGACASGWHAAGGGNGDLREHRLSSGFPSVPVKSSKSVRCSGRRSSAHSCRSTSRTARHSASRKSGACCGTHCAAAFRAIWDRTDSASVTEPREKYWHITRTRLFTASAWSK